MKIISLHLKGYKRVMLNNIREIKIDLNNPIQAILGTNGSGKSSIVSEMSPMPGIPSDFNSGGFKIIEIEHNGHTYHLSSHYEGKGEHQFLKNGLELNDGGTITVQRQLVLQEFGLTDEKIQMLTGQINWTDLTRARREDLFSKMSETDMTYAFGLYKKLATLTRDRRGVIKHLKERLVKETDRLRNVDVDRESLTHLVHRVQNDLTTLLKAHRSDLPDLDVVTEQVKTFHREVSQIQHLVESVVVDDEIAAYGSEDRIAEALKSVEIQLNTKRELMNHHQEEFDRLHTLIGDREHGEFKTVEQLERDLFELDQKINSIVLSDEFRFEGDMSDLIVECQTIKQEMVSILSELPDNSDSRFTQNKYKDVLSALESISSEIGKLNFKIHALEKELAELDHAHTVDCPKCNYQWIPGITEGHIEKSKELLVEYEKTRKTRKEQEAALIQEKEAFEDYSRKFQRLKSIQHSYPKARSLFDWLLSDNRVFHTPHAHIPAIDRWIEAVKRYQTRYTLLKDKNSMNDTLIQLKRLESHGGARPEETLLSVEKTLVSLTDDIRELKAQSSKLTRQIYVVKERIKLMTRLTELDRQRITLSEQYGAVINNHEVNELIRYYQMQLSHQTEQLNQCEKIQGVINDIENSLLDVEKEHEQYKLLTQALSPTDGIIAKQMGQFIAAFIDQVNEVLSQIYTYPLVVQPCGIDSGDLDYKFPIIAGEYESGGKDISMGSVGQKQVINFAFRLVSCTYLGMDGFPLYADEIAQNQDEQHMINMMQYVKSRMDSHRHSQLFVISHLGALGPMISNADVCVLNSSTITLPAVYNQHVMIE